MSQVVTHFLWLLLESTWGELKALIETANLLLLSLALLAGSSCWAAPGDGKRASHDGIALWHERCQKLGSGRTCVMQGCHSRLPFPAHVLLQSSLSSAPSNGNCVVAFNQVNYLPCHS